MSFKSIHLPANPTICILRLSAIGDVCHMLAVVNRLKTALPDAKIVWIIGKTEYSLVSNLTGIEFVVYDKKSGYKGIWELRKKLAHYHFDILLNMQAALRASIISLTAIRAKIKLGFDKKRAKDFQWIFTNRRIRENPKSHVIDGFFGFLEAIGIEKEKLKYPDILTATDRENAKKLIDGNYFVISPCSSDRKRNWRNWTKEGYLQTALYAVQNYNLIPVITGGNSKCELEYSQFIAENCPEAINLVGKTDLKTLLAIIENAKFVVAPDSGPTHMASVVNTPAIGLYAGSNPARTGAVQNKQFVIDKYPEAVAKYLNTTADQVSWGRRVRDEEVMKLIAFEDVKSKIDQIFSTTI